MVGHDWNRPAESRSTRDDPTPAFGAGIMPSREAIGLRHRRFFGARLDRAADISEQAIAI